MAEVQKAKNGKALFGLGVFSFTCMSNNLTMALLAYIMQAYSNAPTTLVQTILTMPALIAMIFAFCVGGLLKVVSNKAVMISGQICLFIFGMIYLFLGGSIPIWAMLLAAGLVGIGQGANYTVLGAILTGMYADEGRRGTIYGIMTALMNVGGVVVTVVGGMLAIRSWQFAYVLFFLVLFGIVVEFICIPREKPVRRTAEEKAAEKQAKQEGKSTRGRMPAKVWFICFDYLFWFMFLYVFGTNVSEYIINTFKLGGSVQASIATSTVTIGGIVAGALFGAYSKFTKKATVPIMMALTFLGLFLPWAITTNLVGIMVGGCLCGFAMSGAGPYIAVEMSRVTKPHQYGMAMSIYSSFMNVGMCIAIYVIAFLTRLVCGNGADIHTRFLVGWVGALICFVFAIPIYMGKGKNKNEDAEQSAQQ